MNTWRRSADNADMFLVLPLSVVVVLLVLLVVVLAAVSDFQPGLFEIIVGGIALVKILILACVVSGCWKR